MSHVMKDFRKNLFTTKKKKIFGEPLSSRAYDFVDQCMSFVERYCSEVGLYRKCGSLQNITDLKNRFENSDNYVLDENEDVHEVAGLLKLFLREMPEPLIPFDLYDVFIAAAAVHEMNADILKNLIKYLPELNVKLLRRLFLHLNMLYQNSSENLMSSSNLAVVFAPSLLISSDPDPTIFIGDIEVANNLIELFVKDPLVYFNMDLDINLRSSENDLTNISVKKEKSTKNNLKILRHKSGKKKNQKTEEEPEVKQNVSRNVSRGRSVSRPLPAIPSVPPVPPPRNRANTRPLPLVPPLSPVQTRTNRKFTVRPYDENVFLFPY
eukprot:TRINITY_DN2347_c0_g1_i1.p1 TRINITY_DN2347_c0_g1~~TRINITY_DN2347_c0_g1_i1.p1  ORF type:complete len:323 (+),score=68.89 TRINITY_DN2347_c0_g1_i1:17-985(+)